MPIITISRGSMSGGRALADCVAAAVDAPCVGRELVVEAAARLGVTEEVLSQKLEKSPGLWERMTHERRIYVAALQAALAEQVVSGHLVYHGFADHLLLTGVPAVLRVRLIAPMATRVRAVMEQHRLAREAAERYIDEVDEDRVRWARFIYGVDLRDPAHYDVTLNLDVLTVASACAAVVDIAKRPEFTVTREVTKQLANFALACRVRVALATNPATRSLDLEVAAENGAVTLSGVIPETPMITHVSTRWERELRSVVERVSGVKAVELNVRAFNPRA
jgi:cytidylate kinase